MKKIVLFTVMLGFVIIGGGASGSPVLYSSWTFGAGDWSAATLEYSDPAPPAVVLTGSPYQPLGASTTVGLTFTNAVPVNWTPAASLSTTKSDLMGNWTTVYPELSALVINFTLKNVSGVLPLYSDALYLYFVSAGVTNLSSGFTIPFSGVGSTVSQTYNVSLTGVTWDSAIAFNDIQSFGFEISGGYSRAQQSYEISDIYLSVPEPETVWMILAVLASLGITFRMRLLELGKQAIARIKA